MYIKITLKDCQNIVNENLQGWGKHSELEVALAKHAIAIHEKLDSVNNMGDDSIEIYTRPYGPDERGTEYTPQFCHCRRKQT